MRLALAVVALLVLGNLVILGMSALIGWRAPAPAVAAPVEDVDNLALVDAKVWRGAAPSLAGYESLAAAGVRTVVDLRAEDDAHQLDGAIGRLGLDVVHLPIRDGQTPTAAQVDQFVNLVVNRPGPVFVHCGAGVGRTGAMAAAYLVRTGQADGRAALFRNLAVGPPSLEQIVYARGLDGVGDIDRPPAAITALSRFLDAPRRIWSRLG